MTPAPQRERLADALAAVTGGDAVTWSRRLPPDPSGRARALVVTDREVRVHDRATASPLVAPLTVDGPQAAWEVLHLAGLVAADALDDPRRRFLPAGLDASATDAAVLAHPATIADAVAFAADWPVVMTAEALTRAYLAPLRVPDAPARVVWRVGVRQSSREGVARMRWARRGTPAATWSWLASWTRTAAVVLAADPTQLDEMRARFDPEQMTGSVPPDVAALRDLIGTGYAIDDLSQSALTLLAPPLALASAR